MIDPVRAYREARAASKIQRRVRVMIRLQAGLRSPHQQKLAGTGSSIMGVVLTTECAAAIRARDHTTCHYANVLCCTLCCSAMRGGRLDDDRTARVLKRQTVHAHRRASKPEEMPIQSMLREGSFSPSQQELATWSAIAHWASPAVDAKAIERRLAYLRQPRRSAHGSAGGERRRYLVQHRPVTATVSRRAASTLTPLRPSSAPSRRPVGVRAYFTMVLAVGRFSRCGIEQDLATASFRRARLA